MAASVTRARANTAALTKGVRRRERHFPPDDAGGEQYEKPVDRRRREPDHDGGGEVYGRPHH